MRTYEVVFKDRDGKRNNERRHMALDELPREGQRFRLGASGSFVAVWVIKRYGRRSLLDVEVQYRHLRKTEEQ